MTQRVLLLEDEPLILLMLCDWVRDIGLEPQPSNKIIAALDDLRTIRPDFAIVDFYIQGQPAYPVLDRLQALKVPTILATGAQPDEIEAAYRHIPKVAKPFQFEEIDKLMRQMLTVKY